MADGCAGENKSTTFFLAFLQVQLLTYCAPTCRCLSPSSNSTTSGLLVGSRFQWQSIASHHLVGAETYIIRGMRGTSLSAPSEVLPLVCCSHCLLVLSAPAKFSPAAILGRGLLPAAMYSADLLLTGPYTVLARWTMIMNFTPAKVLPIPWKPKLTFTGVPGA